MSNRWFPAGLSAFANKEIEWDADDIRVMLVASTYAYDSADTCLADVGTGNDNGRTSASITSKTISSGGVLDGADISLVATSAVACNALIVFKHTGDNATATVLLYIDTATNLPYTPAAGETLTITWSNGASKIAVL